MSTFTIPMTLKKSALRSSSDSLETDHILTLPGYHRLGIGSIPRGSEGRQEMGGPMVPGPWAYTYGKCSSVTSDHQSGSGYETDQLRAAGKVHAVESGDFIVLDGVCYRAEVFRRQYIRLVMVADGHA